MIYERSNRGNCLGTRPKRKSEVQDYIYKERKTDRIQDHKGINFELIIFFIGSKKPESDENNHNKNNFDIGSEVDEFYL
jgi:hypothetical protein